MGGQSSETDSEVDWGVVDVTKRQEFVDSDSESEEEKTGKTRTSGSKKKVAKKPVVKYEFQWELGGVTWETRTSWSTDWLVNFKPPFLSRRKVLDKMKALDKETGINKRN